MIINIIISAVTGLGIGTFIGLIVGTILLLKGYRLKKED